MTLSHNDAHALLQKQIDGRLTSTERAALDAHLHSCEACQRYARNLDHLDKTLSHSLHARWSRHAPEAFTSARQFTDIEDRVRRKRFQKRFAAAAQPVLWTAGVGVLALALIGLLGAIRPGVADEDLTETQTLSPDDASQTYIAQIYATMTADVAGTGTPVVLGHIGCLAEIVQPSEIHMEPSADSDVLATTNVGDVVPVNGASYTDSTVPWLEITMYATTANQFMGWIRGDTVTPDGDCSNVPEIAAGSTPTPSPINPSGSNPPAVKATATIPQSECAIMLPGYEPTTDFNVYTSPGRDKLVIGQAVADQWYTSNGWWGGGPAYDTWARIWFNGELGWIVPGINSMWKCMPGAEGMPYVEIDNPPPANTPTPTAEGQVCYVAPTPDAGDMTVYSLPGGESIGTLQDGEYVQAIGKYYPYNAASWIQIDFHGTPGWVNGGLMFDGRGTMGCWPLPDVDPGVPLPTFTPWADSGNPVPTSTLPADVSYDKVLYVSGSVNSTGQFSGSLPRDDNRTTEYIGIRASIPSGEVRLLEILVQCTGANPQNLRWGYYGSSLDWECGRYIDTGVSEGGNLVVLALAIPSDGLTSVTYTITVTVYNP